MSYLFSDVTDRLTATTFTTPGANGTLSMWVKPTWAHNDGADHMLIRILTDGNNFVQMEKFSDNNIYQGWLVGGANHRFSTAATAAMFTSGTWAHHLITWNDTSNVTEYFLNGVSIGSTSVSLVTASLTAQWCIGNQSNVSAVSVMGRVAKVAYWSDVLSAGNITSLANGAVPSTISAGTLIDGVNLTTNVSPVSYLGNSFTASGAGGGPVFDADNPPELSSNLSEDGMWMMVSRAR